MEKKLNRRKFLVSSAQAAAGIGVLAGCDKRALVGLDVRAPSVPTGLLGSLTSNAQGQNTVILTWTPHDLTDNTGSKTESAITGYNVYRDNIKIASLIPVTSYTDNNGLVENTSYLYAITAVDNTANESLMSLPLLMPVQPKSYVYVVSNSSAVTGNASRPTINTTVVKNMVQAAVMRLTGFSTPTEAFESLFPSLSISSRIGLKINTLGAGNVSTKPAVVQAIVDSLTQMLGATFPAYNIIVFDDRGKDSHMKPAGYILRDEPGKHRIASTNWNTTLHGIPVTTQEAGSGLWGTTISTGSVSQKLSTIVDTVDYIINVPVLKDHSLAGITFAMKNFYGIIDNPASIHGNMCSPYVSWVYKSAANKVKLIIGDALVSCVSGGPAGAATHIINSIVAGTDPVAMDSWALKTINSKRSAKAQISFSDKGDARYIYAASLDPYKLGSTNVVPVVEVQA